MKIVFISDTHGMHYQIKHMPKGDVLIHTGDITSDGSLQQLEDFNSWLGGFDFERIYIIAGNHDFCFEKYPEISRNILTNCIYMEDESSVYKGIKFYGTPWQPRFNDWAFNLTRNGEELQSKWDEIPNDIDILLTHGPPFGVLDKVRSTYFIAGCELLSERIAEIKPIIHAFGHVHEGYGIVRRNGTTYINSSIMSYEYKPINKPIVIEL